MVSGIGRCGKQQSLRATSDEPFVSAPVTWDELEKLRDGSDPAALRFVPPGCRQAGGRKWRSIRRSAYRRAEGNGDLFADLLTAKQKLPATLKATDAAPPKPKGKQSRVRLRKAMI